MKVLRLGIHSSIAGSLEQAALRAAALGANTFQIFTASPRMWHSRPFTRREAAALNDARRRLDLAPLVVHDNYLINLAAADEELRRKSVEAFREELTRSQLVEADYLVFHPGSYRGLTLEQGLRRVAESLAQAANGLGGGGPMLLVENTAGSGQAIGSRFEELAELRRLIEDWTGLRVGFCLDTAHCLAAGYDVASEQGLEDTLRQAERILGLKNVPVIHANDSKAPLGARVDRHEHIGQGEIGKLGFRRILNHPKLRNKAFILETPVEREGDDRRNLRRLKRLADAPEGK
jgi:deoxyribonuclease-4